MQSAKHCGTSCVLMNATFQTSISAWRLSEGQCWDVCVCVCGGGGGGGGGAVRDLLALLILLQQLPPPLPPPEAHKHISTVTTSITGTFCQRLFEQDRSLTLIYIPEEEEWKNRPDVQGQKQSCTFVPSTGSDLMADRESRLNWFNLWPLRGEDLFSRQNHKTVEDGGDAERRYVINPLTDSLGIRCTK